jgi:CHAT domain-containing protein
MTDEEKTLIAGCVKADKPAWDEFVQQYSKLVYHTIRKTLEAQLEMIHGKVDRQLLAQRGVGGVGKLGQTPAARSSSQKSISTSHPYFWAPFILVGDGK